MESLAGLDKKDDNERNVLNISYSNVEIHMALAEGLRQVNYKTNHEMQTLNVQITWST